MIEFQNKQPKAAGGVRALLAAALVATGASHSPIALGQDIVIEEIVVTGEARGKRRADGDWAQAQGEYPDNLQVQTGPGLPSWRWQQAQLVRVFEFKDI